MNSAKILSIGAVLCAGIYLFVTAPTELPDGEKITAGTMTVNAQQIFNTANSINDAARFIYTKQIVGHFNKNSVHNFWLWVHIALAGVLMPLSLLHVYVALAFK